MSDSGASASAGTRNYKKTLNLPKTSFPMRANLVQNEPASRKRWEQRGLYARLRERRAGAERFTFHDGPPYANAAIHMGHLLNKVLKDFVVRSQSMGGRDCPYIPGWDCHGLPIEHIVMSRLIESGKIEKLDTLDEEKRRLAIRSECEKHARKSINLQTEQMKRLLTLADYDAPYLTMDPSYESCTLEVFARLIEQGLVYRALKSVHWSLANETALADAELEYYEREDPSIYVEFEAADRSAVRAAFGLDESELNRTPTLMIWTTTPWTIPANVAIAVHPKLEYALIDQDGSLTIVAADALSNVVQAAKTEAGRVIAKTTGERLIGLRYRHPFVDTEALAARFEGAPAIHRVVPAEYVTLETGTGLVHTAPGHGADDYQTGLKEGLPVYCPVLEDGRYDETVPEWIQGQRIWDANPTIVKKLRESGHMFFDTVISHSYPHDWRGKSPVIFRATEQWFVAVDGARTESGKTLREMALEGAQRVSFIPEWGRNRMRGMLESRPDWCISRQRAWGLPIPAFFDSEGRPLLTAASVRAVALRIAEAGSDAWFREPAADLLRHYDPSSDPEKPDWLTEVRGLEKGRDIFDVWFESGSSWNGALRARSDGGDFPADLYLEGSDQHRGWFQLSMLCALGAMGEAPFRALLTHGFIVDKHGRKMSKSLGNTINVEDLLRDFGADVCRWWVSSLAFENDIKVDLEFIRSAGESYRKVRNTLRFMLSNLHDFDPERDAVDIRSVDHRSLEAWALAEQDRVSARVRAAYQRFDYRAAHIALYNFCNETLSSIYLAAVKDRLYCDAPESPRRRRTQTTLWRLCDGLCRLLAPLLPHTADEAFRELRAGEGDPCVHEETFPDPFEVEADPGWQAVMEARDLSMTALEQSKASGGPENPLDCELTMPDPKGALDRFDPVDLADLLGVSRVRIDASAERVGVADLRGEPRCERSWKRDGTVKERSDGGMLSDRDAAAVGVG